MATTLSTGNQFHHHHHHHFHRRQPSLPPFKSLAPNPKLPFLIPSFSSSQSSPTTTISDSLLNPGRFLSNEELEKLQTLEKFRYFQNFEHGRLSIRVMRVDEMDLTAGLLSESFVESMLLPSGYVFLLMFLVKQYLVERRGLVPHAATLIGFYEGNEVDNGDGDAKGEGELAGTVEVSFDRRGANASPPTPTPPKDYPYVCNMTVKKPLRRRGLGWHLLKASEELISQMTSSTDVYLHCRMIDEAPFKMYLKAGYNVVQTDTIFILLTLQRRKHLMRKKLLPLENPSEMDIAMSDEE